MKKKVMEKLVKALRSGKFKQGKSKLKTGDAFCCLGVLCDISGQSEWDAGDHYDGEISYLPKSVMTWSGVRSATGKVGDTSLADENDGGKTFDEIADIIEQHWKHL